MTVVRKQEDFAEQIKDAKVKDVFDTCAKLEDASDKVEWTIRLIHVDSFSKEDPCEAENFTEESYMFDNQRLVEFLNKYYGSAKKVSFQNSPDCKRIYLNYEEVEILGTIDGKFDNTGTIVVAREVDYLTAEIEKTTGNLELYTSLVKHFPGYDWNLSNCEGVTLNTDNKKFKDLDSKVIPFVNDGEVTVREIAHVETTLNTDKWMIFIDHESDCLDRCIKCGACCD